MKKLNWNKTVKVKLTERGLQAYRDHYAWMKDKLGEEVRDPKVDEDGYSRFQLWSFMRIFGSIIYLGSDNVVEDISFYIDDEDLEEAEMEDISR